MALDLDDNLDSLLDKNLDDIEDLPEFRQFPAGAHKLSVNWESKEKEWNDKDHGKQKGKVIVAKLTYLELVELADKKDEVNVVAAGTQTMVEFNPYYERSLSALKGVLKNMEPVIGSSNLKELIRGTDGFEVIAVTRMRKYKGQDGDWREQMVLVEFHPS